MPSSLPLPLAPRGGAHVASGLHVKWTCSCPASFRLLKLCGVQCPDRPRLSRRPGIPPFTNSRHGQAGWENLASLAPRPSIPRAHPGWSSGAAASPASLSPGALQLHRPPPWPQEGFKRLCRMPHHVAQKDILIGL